MIGKQTLAELGETLQSYTVRIQTAETCIEGTPTRVETYSDGCSAAYVLSLRHAEGRGRFTQFADGRTYYVHLTFTDAGTLTTVFDDRAPQLTLLL